jgi:hypothetical protein
LQKCKSFYARLISPHMSRRIHVCAGVRPEGNVGMRGARPGHYLNLDWRIVGVDDGCFRKRERNVEKFSLHIFIKLQARQVHA